MSDEGSTTGAKFFLAVGFDLRAAGVLTLFTVVVQSLFMTPIVPFGYSGILYSGSLLIIAGHFVQMVVWSIDE